jgi:hypothetical protein
MASEKGADKAKKKQAKKISADDAEDYGEKIGGIPLIFMFQPTEFVVAKGDRLREWEELMVRNVGLDRFSELKDRKFRTRGFETISICPGAGADDCDWHDEDPPWLMAEA